MLPDMANRLAQAIIRAGVTPTYNAAAAGDTVTPGDSVFIHVKNAAGSATTCTVAAVGGEGGLPLEPLAVAIPVGETIFGPIIPDLFANVSDGEAHLTWGSVTSITFAVLEI